MPEPPKPQDMNLGQMMNAAYNVCTIFTMPVEIVLRPAYSSRYFQPPIMVLSAMLMIFLPAVTGLFTGVVSMIPFSHGRAPQGMFGIGDYSRIFFLLMAIHSFRVWKRMIHMETEVNSEWEGPPLPFFKLVPGGKSFWMTRILIEPLFVFIFASVLSNLFIIQTGLSLFLQLAALMLAMKNYIAWFREWEYLRKLMDIRNTAPIISRLVRNQATHDELAQIHIASFPQGLPPDIHRSAVAHIAKAYSVNVEDEKFREGE